MPYVVEKDTKACSADKPYAVKTKDSGKVHGCHATKKEAQDQQAALYANTDEVAIQAAIDELMFVRSAAVNNEDFPAPEVTYDHDGIVLARLENVPLMYAGMEWPSSTGPATFGSNHLVSASTATSDPLIPRPRVKLGHTDPRYNGVDCECGRHIDPPDMFDADLNFGFVENMVLEEERTLLRADLVDVPLWLAQVAPVAFPSRSIEGWFSWIGPNKKEYPFIMTACALLGVYFPAILSLPDLPKLYGSEMPDFIKVEEAVAA